MTHMSTDRLLRVAYFSRNALELSQTAAQWEIDRILEKSQANNARCDVTGVLMFNQGSFAQVLEGPAKSVETVFDRIQLDDRHYDVTVLETNWAEDRLFAGWSMGFAGCDALNATRYAGVADRSSFDLEALSASGLIQLLTEISKRNELTLRAA